MAEATDPKCILCRSDKTRLFAALEHGCFLLCDTCQLIYRSPEERLDCAAERARYEKHENSPNDPQYRQFLMPLVRSLAAKLEEDAIGLDFGSGPGPAIPAMMQELGFQMQIYDPFFAPSVSVFEKSYSFVTSSETFEHLFHPMKELRRLDSVMKRGAWLGIMTQFFDDKSRFESSHYHRDPTHVAFYSEATFKTMAIAMEWQVEFPTKNVVLFNKPY